MTVAFILLALFIIAVDELDDWWQRRTPLGLVNSELARARERRRRRT